MYCLQWLLPVLLIPKPVNAALMPTHAMFVALYLLGFFLERKPCAICSVLFLAAVLLICHSGLGCCLFWADHCDLDRCHTTAAASASAPHHSPSPAPAPAPAPLTHIDR
ncbi:BLCAP apoptosis inducing factor bc10 [Arctopsyche grandis]|uniref:BLCAP apoptosis inducing factor bc10 n=1 Tax=Arctopsyche grandis TaxID=121162 RepID=UPI00406D7EF1